MQRKIVEAPISDIESQVLCDHHEPSPQEAKIVAATLLRCSDYASQHGILPDMHAVPSSSSDEVISLSGPSAILPVSVTPLVISPATPDLSIVVHSCVDTMVEPLPRPYPSESSSSQQPLHQDSVPSRLASSSSRRSLKPMRSETAVDMYLNESVEQNVPNIPSPITQVVSSLSPELGVNSANQQDRAAPNSGATRTIKRMNSFEALQHEFGEG